MSRITNFLKGLRDIVLWFIRDHNGKPSSTRVIMMVITWKVIMWGDHLVFNTDQGISDNLLYSLGLVIIGTAFFMRLLSQKHLIQGVVGIVSKRNPQMDTTTVTATGQQAPDSWWSGGLKSPTESQLDGPGQ